MKVIEIEGIGKKYAGKLSRAGYTETEDLSKLTWEEINEVAKKTKISPKLIDKWQEQADLVTLKGVGPEFAELLNKIGIDSVKELSKRNAQSTLEKIKAFDKRRPNVVRKLPTNAQVESWIKEAKDLYDVKKEKKTPKMNIIDIEGIGPKYAKTLKAKAGIEKLEDLMVLTKAKIKEVAVKTKISEKMIDKWQEHANLMKIDGIGPEYADVLNQIGIDSVKELSKRDPQGVLDKIIEFDKGKPNVIRKLPTLVNVKNWVVQSKKM
jgi:predicted flap endonuclease-1-like 5' DNA nuclease